MISFEYFRDTFKEYVDKHSKVLFKDPEHKFSYNGDFEEYYYMSASDYLESIFSSENISLYEIYYALESLNNEGLYDVIVDYRTEQIKIEKKYLLCEHYFYIINEKYDKLILERINKLFRTNV